MRCHYLSDLHLERQPFETPLPGGDALIIAGDLCNARCFQAAPEDRYHNEQRDRVMRFVDHALARFGLVLLIAGNHEHYGMAREDTAGLLRRSLPGVSVLDDDIAEIDGYRFFGTTLWTDFAGGNPAQMDAVRKRRGEYFFVQTRSDQASAGLRKFQPEDAYAAHRSAWAALQRACTNGTRGPDVLILHHAPSLRGLCPKRKTKDLDCCDASDLDASLSALPGIKTIIHGHTHIAGTYRIGDITVHSNAYGLPGKNLGAAGFSVHARFDL